MKLLLQAAFLGVCLTVLLPLAAQAQGTSRIEGTVTLQDSGEALHGARILIIELGRSTLTDRRGKFAFGRVPVGIYQLLAVREHLQAERVSMTVVPGVIATADFALSISAVHEEITVTATGRETTAFDAFNSVQVLDSVDLAQNMASNIGELLENEPGVAKRSFGPGSSRPIIRGFDSDRVLIMQDGIRSGDLSSQSGDHGVSIDPGGLQRIEILRGPATLLYGSNAIGGVVNTISPQQQFYQDPPDELRGQINADFGSTNDQAGGSANFQYGHHRFMAWAGSGARRTGEFNTPEGLVENSQTEQVNGRLGLGWFGEKRYLSASYQIEDAVYAIPFAGELHSSHAGEQLFIDIDSRRQVMRIEGGFRGLNAGLVDGVKATISYIDWKHKEVERFPETGESTIGAEFNNEHYIGRLEVQQGPLGGLSGQFGIWAQRRNYVATGTEALAPPTEQDAFAGFAYEELKFDGFSLQLGSRLEYNNYRPEERMERNHEEEEGRGGHDEEYEPPEIRDRNFIGFSASVGVRVPFSDNKAAFVANFTSSYRSPSLDELYNFGPHTGNLTFEIGNPNLKHERSNGGEVSLRLNTGNVHGQASFFFYDISNFIFGAPTGEFVDSLAKLEFTQGDSRFAGVDLNLSFHASNQWRFHIGGGMVDARFKDLDTPLPRIPPLSSRLAIDWLPITGLQVRPELVLASEQDDVFGSETPTDGYTLLNLMVSYTLAGPKRMHIFTLRGTNLTDELYRNHTSFIKALAPEMGRRALLTYALRLF